MEDEASTSLDGKVLGNLRVVDLKQELEKRGLSKSGSKKDLVKRLKQQLEFEKLCEERKSSGDLARKLELDDKIQQNEFVQQYLAQQQKRYAEREEEKRLQLEAMQKQKDGNSVVSIANQVKADQISFTDSEEEDNEKDLSINKPSTNEPQKSLDDVNLNITEPVKKDESHSSSSETEDEQSCLSKSVPESVSVDQDFKSHNKDEPESVNVDQNDFKSHKKDEPESLSVDQDFKNHSKDEPESVNQKDSESHKDEPESVIVDQKGFESHKDEPKSVSVISEDFKSHNEDESESVSVHQEDNIDEPESDQNIIHRQSFIDVAETSQNPSSPSSYNVRSCKKTSLNSESSSENVVERNVVSMCISDDTEEQNNSKSDNLKKSPYKTEKPDVFVRISKDENDNEMSSSAIHSSDIKTHTAECTEFQSEVSSTHKEEDKEKNIVASHGSPEIVLSSEPKHQFAENMETSECSSVPYPISDIQLPESPGQVLKFKDLQKDDNSKTEPLSDTRNVKSPPLDNKTQSNGDAGPENLNSSHEDMSESETKENSYTKDSPEKLNQRKDSTENRQSDESSDEESDKNDSHVKKKSFSYEDTSSNVAVDSDESPSKENVNKQQKSQQQSNESDNEKSSDSEKYRQRVDSKHKSHVKHRKRNRRSRSQSSSSSSSHSSDSSPKHRHSKKSVVTKTGDFIDNEDSNHDISDRNLGEKPKQFEKDDKIESTPISSTSPKKRYKIKRDNAPVEEVPTKNATSSEKIEKNSSRFTPHSPPKQESSEIKDDMSELLVPTYTSRKVNLSNPKLKRKTSEDESNEMKSKTSKFESFPKLCNPVMFTADFLKSLFPEFKPMGDAPSPMELDAEDQPVAAVDEKNTIVPTDVSNGNDSGTRRESTSQIDLEDSESMEPNYEETLDQGPVSKIIFIQNLVRPFTLNQLKDLVKNNGKIIEEYFWIDKIKSKCFVMYESEKDAIKARNALNNTRWPSSNPKILSVEFSNEEELEQHKKGNEPPPPKPVTEPPVAEIPEIIETRITHPVEEHKRKDKERRKDRERSKHQVPVREWDKDKIMQDSPEREHIPKEEKPRSSEKKDKKESKKRPNEDTPAKLLDDLFQKTKNAPCIYWLPLTEEQAKEKEEANKLRKLEREKRNQQQKELEAERRNKRDRSSRRSREKENRKSSTRSRSPVSRRR